MSSVVFGKIKKHDKNIVRTTKSRYDTENAFIAYLLTAKEKANEAGIQLYFSNPFGGWYLPNLTIDGDKVIEHRHVNERPRDVASQLSTQNYIMEARKEGFNVTIAKKAVRQIERIFKKEGIKRISRKSVLRKYNELRYEK